ncbi:acetylglucosamine-6-sulfatase [Saccharobesus litoralis]|uniref:Acetylglucosamine-6-sulfatase n=1 Tax=Saccharobesus litoralis TaxID=2172099 RepID=A0A2S0VUG3_9ALTE|nr:sulfatase [Saccharobesus litoralis]AWB67845.1 acetylglucosamine-6-sulfatase [Saccharobesus litoralis]
MKLLKKIPIVLLASSLAACQVTSIFNSDSSNSSKEIAKKQNVSKKMNVLYIMTDDHAARAVGAYGGRFASLNPTPNLDKLASEGMLYKNVFVTNSICAPSRATILTGQYSQTNGVMDLIGSIGKEQQHLPNLVKQAGYETAIIGKWHLKKEPAAFDYYEVLKLQGKYFDPDFRVRGDKPWPQNQTQYKGHSSDVITNLSIDWLKNRNSDKPFFLMHQFKAPHDYFEYAPRYESYLADVDIPEPSDMYEWHEKFGSVATRGENDSLISEIGTSISKRNTRRNMGEDLKIDTGLPNKEFTRQTYQKFLKAYLRCVKGVDDNIARLIQTLKDMGEYENTIIIYTSDQGMMLGEHDYQDKRWMWDPSIHMPFIVHDPRMKNPGRTSDLIINNTDFAPFMLDLVGLDTPDYMHGRSFAATLQGETPKNWRTASYYRYWSHRKYHDVPAHFGVRTEDYKLIFYYGQNFLEPSAPFYQRKWSQQTGKNPNATPTPAAWELYDLRKDPQETKNVYHEPQYAGIIAKLKKELIRQREMYNETDVNYPQLQKIIDKHWHD